MEIDYSSDNLRESASFPLFSLYTHTHTLTHIYVYVCVVLYICVHGSVHMCACRQLHARMNARTNTRTYERTHTRAHTQTHRIYVFVCMLVDVCVCGHAPTLMCVFVFVHVYVCMMEPSDRTKPITVILPCPM